VLGRAPGGELGPVRQRPLFTAFVLASVLAAAAPARGDPPTRAQLRSAVAARRAQRVIWRAALRESAEHVGGSAVLHQVREPRHRALWREALAVRPRAREVLRRWIASGRYPGLWTLPGVEPWYHVDVAGPAVRIRLRDDAILFDRDIPEHRAVYEAWIENERALRGPEPPNRFDLLRDDDGVPFSLRAQIVGKDSGYAWVKRRLSPARASRFGVWIWSLP